MGTPLDAPPVAGVRVRWSRAVTRVRRAVLTRRRSLAALLVAAATAAGIQAVAAPPPATVPVVVAARDLPAGATLTDDDLEAVDWPARLAPEDRRARVAGLVGGELVSPLAAGEPVTGPRLLGASLADASPGLTALPLRLPDPGVVELVRPGDRIDLIATDPADGGSRQLASDVLVVPHHGSRSSSTAAFIAATQPRWVIFPVGYLNRFRHPNAQVWARWAATGAGMWRTDAAGAVSVHMAPGGPRFETARAAAPRYWHGR